MRPKVTLAPLPVPAKDMPAWRSMWPGEWRYRAFMLTTGWRIARVAAWFISVGINRPSASGLARDGAAQAATWRPEENAFIYFTEYNGAVVMPLYVKQCPSGQHVLHGCECIYCGDFVNPFAGMEKVMKPKAEPEPVPLAFLFDNTPPH